MNPYSLIEMLRGRNPHKGYSCSSSYFAKLQAALNLSQRHSQDLNEDGRHYFGNPRPLCSVISLRALSKALCSKTCDFIINIESRRMQVLFCGMNNIISVVFVHGTERIFFEEVVCPCKPEHKTDVEFKISVNRVKKDCTCFMCVTHSYTYCGENNFKNKFMMFNHIWYHVVSATYNVEWTAQIYFFVLIYTIHQSFNDSTRRITFNSSSRGREWNLGHFLYSSYRFPLLSLFVRQGTLSDELKDFLSLLATQLKPERKTLTRTRYLWPSKTRDITKIKGWRKKNFHPEFLAAVDAENQSSPERFDTQLTRIYRDSVSSNEALKYLQEKAADIHNSRAPFESDNLETYLNGLPKLRVSFPIPRPNKSSSSQITEFRGLGSSSKDVSKESVYPMLPPLDNDDPTKKLVCRSIKSSERKWVMAGERPIHVTSSKYRSVRRKFLSSVEKSVTKEEYNRLQRIPFNLKTREDLYDIKCSKDSFCELEEEEVKREMDFKASLFDYDDLTCPPLVAYSRLNAEQYKLLGNASEKEDLLKKKPNKEDVFKKHLKHPSETEIAAVKLAFSVSSVADCLQIDDPSDFCSECGKKCDVYYLTKCSKKPENVDTLDKEKCNNSVTNGFAQFAASAFKITQQFETVIGDTSGNRDGVDTEANNEDHQVEVHQVLMDILDFTERNMEIPPIDYDPDQPFVDGTPEENDWPEENDAESQRKFVKWIKSLATFTSKDLFPTECSKGEFCLKGCVCLGFGLRNVPAHCCKARCMLNCTCAVGKMIKEELESPEGRLSGDGMGMTRKRKKKLPQRFKNHVIGKEFNNIDRMTLSPEPKLRKKKSVDREEIVSIVISDDSDSSESPSSESPTSGSPLSLWETSESKESREECSSEYESDTEEDKKLRERRLKLGYISRKSNPKLSDVAIWCAEHKQYNCNCVNWVVMLKSNALVWKPETDESLTMSEMKCIPLNKSEFNVSVSVFNPEEHSSRSRGSLYDYQSRNASKYFREKQESELENRVTFSNGFVKIGVEMAEKGLKNSSLKPTGDFHKMSKECEFVIVKKTMEDAEIEIGSVSVKSEKLCGKNLKRKVGDVTMDGESEIMKTIRFDSNKESHSKRKKAGNVKNEKLAGSERPSKRKLIAQALALGLQRFTARKESTEFPFGSSSASSVSDSSSRSTSTVPSRASSPLDSTLLSNNKPNESSKNTPSSKTASSGINSKNSRSTSEIPKSENSSDSTANDSSSSPSSQVKRTVPKSNKNTLPEHALICLNTGFGYLEVLELTPKKLVLADPESPSNSHVFMNVDAASSWLNRFLRKKMTFFPPDVVLKWILVKTGILKLKGTLPFDPKILQPQNVVTVDRVILFKKIDGAHKFDILPRSSKESKSPTLSKESKLCDEDPSPSLKKKTKICDKEVTPRKVVTEKGSQGPKKAPRGKPVDPWILNKIPSNEPEEKIMNLEKPEFVPQKTKRKNARIPKFEGLSPEKKRKCQTPELADEKNLNKANSSIDSDLENSKKSKRVRARTSTGTLASGKPDESNDESSESTSRSTPETEVRGAACTTLPSVTSPVELICLKPIEVPPSTVPQLVPIVSAGAREQTRWPPLAPKLPTITRFSTGNQPITVQAKIAPSLSTTCVSSNTVAHNLVPIYSINSHEPTFNAPVTSVITPNLTINGVRIYKSTGFQVRGQPTVGCQPGSLPSMCVRTVVPKSSQEPLKEIVITRNVGPKMLPSVEVTSPKIVRVTPTKNQPTLLPNIIKNVVIQNGALGYFDDNRVFVPLRKDKFPPSLIEKK